MSHQRDHLSCFHLGSHEISGGIADKQTIAIGIFLSPALSEEYLQPKVIPGKSYLAFILYHSKDLFIFAGS